MPDYKTTPDTGGIASDETGLDDVDRAGLQVLAHTVREANGDDVVCDWIERAALSGSRQDYEAAQLGFDSLPAESRQSIGQNAVTTARVAGPSIRAAFKGRVTEIDDTARPTAIEDAPSDPPTRVPRHERSAWDQPETTAGADTNAHATAGRIRQRRERAVQQDALPEELRRKLVMGTRWD